MLTLRLLGEMSATDAAGEIPLPRSKKTRALLAYVVLTGGAHRRERLCEIFWDLPDDPRGALRWSLSRLRTIVDEPEVKRIKASRDYVAFDAGEAKVDFIRVSKAHADGFGKLDTPELEALADDFQGDLLDGLDLPHLYEFHSWWLSEREDAQRIERALRQTLIERYADTPDRALPHARRLVRLDPLDDGTHERLIDLLKASNRVREAEAQRLSSVQLLESEGVPVPTGLRSRIAGSAVAAGRAVDMARPIAQLKEAEVEGDTEVEGAPEAGSDPVEVEAHKPALAVLPFENLGGAPEDQYFVDGLTEEIATALSHIKWMLVISRQSTMALQERRLTPREMAAELDVDYILEGSVVRSAKQARVNLRLIDARHGSHIWAQRIELPLENLLQLYDDAAGQIAAAIEPSVRRAEIDRSRRKPAANMTAYDHYLQALPFVYGMQGMDKDKAIAQLEKALAVDPDYAQALALLAWVRVTHSDYFTPEAIAESVAMAKRAAQIADEDAFVLGTAAAVVGYHDKDWSTPTLWSERALSINPNSVTVLIGRAWGFVYSGDAGEALELFARAERLSPYDPVAYLIHAGQGCAWFRLGDDRKAASVSRKAAAENPTFQTSWRTLAAALVRLGKLEEAQEAVRRLVAVAPHESISFIRTYLPYRDTEMMDRLCAALSEAGLPDG